MTLVYIAIAIVIILIVLVLKERASSSKIPDNLSDKYIRQLAQQGKKIQAIKYYRLLHGVGLKDAKEAVEEMIDRS